MTEPDTTFHRRRDRRRAAGGHARARTRRSRRELRKLVRDGFPRKRRLPALSSSPGRSVAAAASRRCSPWRWRCRCSRAARTSGPRSRSRRRRRWRSASPRRAAPAASSRPPAPTASDFAPGRAAPHRALGLPHPGRPRRRDRPVADGITTVTDRYRGFVLRSSLSTGEDGGRRRLPAAHPRQGPPARAARPGEAGRGALAQPVGPGRDARVRVRHGPPAGRPRRAPQPAAPPGGRRHRRRGGGHPPPPGPERRRDPRPARPGARAAHPHRLRGGERDPATATATTAGRRRTDGDGLGGALDDALGSLEDSVEILVRVLGVAIPLGLLAAALALGARGAQAPAS